jgi:hypothetical protein
MADRSEAPGDHQFGPLAWRQQQRINVAWRADQPAIAPTSCTSCAGKASFRMRALLAFQMRQR